MRVQFWFIVEMGSTTASGADPRALLLHHGLWVVLVSCSCKGDSARGDKMGMVDLC